MTFLKAFLTTCLVCLLSFSYAQTGHQFEKKLHKLYDQKEYFQLRSELKKQETLPLQQRLFYEIILANAFNQCDYSNRLIAQFKKKYKSTVDDSMQIILAETEADNFIKLYRYREASLCFDSLINKYNVNHDSATIADWKDSKALWNAIKNVPPQQIIIDHLTIIPYKRNGMSNIELPVSHHEDTCKLVFDTGANLSVITESNARKLGMKKYDVDINFASGISGSVSKSSLAVADTLYLGNILIKNGVFLLVPDELLNFKALGFKQSGIIGEPIIAQLKEITIYKDGRFEVPLQASKNHHQNLFLNGLMPIANFSVANDSLLFGFDTGAASSVLYEPFFDRYKAFVIKNGTRYLLKSMGVGGKIVESPSYILKNFKIGIQCHETTLSKIYVRTTPVGTNRDLFFGNLGQDLFQKFRSMTINLQSMFVYVTN